MTRDESDEEGQREEMICVGSELLLKIQTSSEPARRTHPILEGDAPLTPGSTELTDCRSDKAVTTNANRKIYPVSQATRNP